MNKIVRIIFSIVLIVCLVACCSSSQKKDQCNSDCTIKVFFTPSTDCEKNIIKAIDNANKMDIAVYSITNPAITNSIIAAHNRGATIRIVTDKQMAKGKGSSVEKLRSAGIPILTNKQHKIEHNNPYVTGSSPVARANFPQISAVFLYFYCGNLFRHKDHKNVIF